MKIDQNIKDTIRASAIIMSIVVLIVVCIEVYVAVTSNETEEIHGFLTLAMSLHDDIDGDEVRDDILSLIDNISGSQIENPEEIDLALARGLHLMKAYKERFYVLISPTDEMRALKESLIKEGGLFLSSYHYLKEAWESKNDDNYNAYLSNLEKAGQCLDDAADLRLQNGTELDRWEMEIEAELSD
jgi:hypothetical protein